MQKGLQRRAGPDRLFTVPKTTHQQETVTLVVLRQVLKDLQRCRIGPLQIIQHHHHRTIRCAHNPQEPCQIPFESLESITVSLATIIVVVVVVIVVVENGKVILPILDFILPHRQDPRGGGNVAVGSGFSIVVFAADAVVALGVGGTLLRRMKVSSDFALEIMIILVVGQSHLVAEGVKGRCQG